MSTSSRPQGSGASRPGLRYTGRYCGEDHEDDDPSRRRGSRRLSNWRLFLAPAAAERHSTVGYCLARLVPVFCRTTHIIDPERSQQIGHARATLQRLLLSGQTRARILQNYSHNRSRSLEKPADRPCQSDTPTSAIVWPDSCPSQQIGHARATLHRRLLSGQTRARILQNYSHNRSRSLEKPADRPCQSDTPTSATIWTDSCPYSAEPPTLSNPKLREASSIFLDAVAAEVRFTIIYSFARLVPSLFCRTIHIIDPVVERCQQHIPRRGRD
ncbi:hypothetical protein J6590_056207 [Homalodisca vitripennis]|nr:hypothetical protein J6590_056207 [Homalodisca vitripennis]